MYFIGYGLDYGLKSQVMMFFKEIWYKFGIKRRNYEYNVIFGVFCGNIVGGEYCWIVVGVK